LVVGLDKQVHMIGLDRKMNDAKPRPRGSLEGAAHFEEDDLFAQARKPPRPAQRHVRWVPALVLGPQPVGHAARRNVLSSRTTAVAIAEIQRELTGGGLFQLGK